MVVLPFVPVTPAIGLGSIRAASSTSLHTGTPAARAASTWSVCDGTPGLFTTALSPSHRHNVTPEDGFDAELAKPPHVEIGARCRRRATSASGHTRRIASHAATPLRARPDDQVARPAHRYFEKKR